jgi:D-3-phosphoglycerate dehydrogenase
VIAIHGIGTDAVPVDLATRRGIAVLNTPEANLQSVAEHAWALLLAASKHLPNADRAARNRDFAFKLRSPSREIQGRTLALLGFGKIAQRVAAMGRAFDVRVIALSPTKGDEVFAAAGVERVSGLAELLERADFLSLHVPLTDATRGLIGPAELALLKPDAILINTSRGAVIDESALAVWLKRNPAAAAGIDVFAKEPPEEDNPLLTLPNVVLSPHSAASSDAALRRMGMQAVQGVLDVLAGRYPRYPVNPEVLDVRSRAEAS